jgi:hypothetical protein
MKIKFIEDHSVAWDGLNTVKIKSGTLMDVDNEIASILIAKGAAIQDKQRRSRTKASTEVNERGID